MHPPNNHYDFEKKLSSGQILLIIVGIIALAALMILKLIGFITV